MKQIVIISGKGGTGKTVLTASFAALAKNACFADCDVDAADLHLLLSPKIKEEYDFLGEKKAAINKTRCISCGKCVEVCRFDAISSDYVIDSIACEGCRFCAEICPEKAIEMKENISGKWFVCDTQYGPMVHAKLGMGEANSGKLVTIVRGKAKEIAEKKRLDMIVIDGPPGIGCPVIASLSQVNCAVVVTEPTLSGLHDAKRVIKTAGYFKTEVKLIINKSDLNSTMTLKIKEFAKRKNIEVLGEIPFNSAIVKAMTKGKSIVENKDSFVAKTIRRIWEKLEKTI